MAFAQKKLRQILKLCTAKELAESIGISPPLLHWHIKQGHVPRPGCCFEKAKLYSEDQAEEVMEFFRNWNARQEH
jgi:hypothetical protein